MEKTRLFVFVWGNIKDEVESDDRTQSHVEPHERPRRRSSLNNKLHALKEVINSDSYSLQLKKKVG